MTAMAAPVMAQTSVTSSGREGPTACVGVAEVNAANLPITALSISGVTVTAPQVTWSQVLAPLGDGQAPSNAVVAANIVNGRTKAEVGDLSVLGIISSSSPTYAGGSSTKTGLEARTLYEVEVVASPAGGTSHVIARRCFMTGGSYTMAVDPAAGQNERMLLDQLPAPSRTFATAGAGVETRRCRCSATAQTTAIFSTVSVAADTRGAVFGSLPTLFLNQTLVHRDPFTG